MVPRPRPNDRIDHWRARFRAGRQRSDDRRPSLRRAVGWGLLLVTLALAGCLDPAESAEDCTGTLQATAQDDESVRLSWEDTANGSEAKVHRKSDGGDYGLIAITNGTTYHDRQTEAGTTYTYFVDFGDETCGTAQVTTVPFFGLLPGLLTGVAVVLGYAVLRRGR